MFKINSFLLLLLFLFRVGLAQADACQSNAEYEYKQLNKAQKSYSNSLKSFSKAIDAGDLEKAKGISHRMRTLMTRAPRISEHLKRCNIYAYEEAVDYLDNLSYDMVCFYYRSRVILLAKETDREFDRFVEQLDRGEAGPKQARYLEDRLNKSIDNYLTLYERRNRVGMGFYKASECSDHRDFIMQNINYVKGRTQRLQVIK